MDYIIGRDAQTRQLSVSANGQVRRFGQAGSVPMDVSRQHLSLKSLGDGRWQIQNLNAANVTYVNGIAVESKTITETDKVELGQSHFLFPWDAVRTPKEETVDIRPLRKVWEEYDAATTETKLSHQKMQNYQKLTGILSTCGILFMFANELGYMRYVLTAFSVSIAIFFFVRGFSPDSSLDLKLKDLKDKFDEKYRCPKCGHYFDRIGNYKKLVQYNACPNCKAKFRK